MPKNRSLALLVIVIAGTVGCASKQPTVFVDLDQVLAGESLPPAPKTPKPQAPQPIPASSLTLPALPPAAFRLGASKQRIQEIENVLLQSRQDAFALIQSRLQAGYRSAIERGREEALLALQPQSQAAQGETDKRFQKLFNDYAASRAKLVIRLALVASFPDIDPNSEDVPPKSAVFANYRFEKAKPLRAEIAVLDKNFRGAREALFTKANSEEITRIQAVNADFDSRISKADSQAEEQAKAEVGKEQEQLESVLKNNSVVAFPPEPAQTVTVGASSTPSSPPEVQEPSHVELIRQMRAADISDLKVWAALRGYVISSHRRGVRNATSEFIQWKHSHLALP
jgi:hypothetical protein